MEETAERGNWPWGQQWQRRQWSIWQQTSATFLAEMLQGEGGEWGSARTSCSLRRDQGTRGGKGQGGGWTKKTGGKRLLFIPGGKSTTPRPLGSPRHSRTPLLGVGTPRCQVHTSPHLAATLCFLFLFLTCPLPTLAGS